MMNNQAVVLNQDDRMHIVIGLELYLSNMRKACLEDQGDPNGKPGTIGNIVQENFKQTLERFKETFPQY
jgi:hypothetical protein